MTRDRRFHEKRQFGRRQTIWHAWIKVAGREREPCIVRNFSITGALLEFEGAPPVAARFRLMIDAYRFEAECYVRHRSATGVGVYFDELALPQLPPWVTRPHELVAMLKRGAASRSH